MTHQLDMLGLALDEASARRLGLQPQPRQVRAPRLNVAAMHPVDLVKSVVTAMGLEMDPVAEAAARAICEEAVDAHIDAELHASRDVLHVEPKEQRHG